ncbi:hypothetical protein R5W24_001848 [Gemmata sp. JC717]|uniref:hypothetical protein n=1 Tax=Gemmata algarum TaxID=2975278 RepID=UPI0021BB0436|nr:hypothetical protein [Gemmata algarum]MDY3552759.1 hypothetical protein [Gemmata algarum]
MTEEEWLACDDPELLTCEDIGTRDRKWRLVLCACCRRVWKRLVDERSRRAIEQSERYADGLISDEEMGTAESAAFAAWTEISNKHGDSPWRAGSAAAAYSSQHSIPENDRSNAMGAVIEGFSKAARRTAEQRAQAQIIRDVFGNPFRLVAFFPSWRTDTVVALAQQMYASRDFSAMPILADALQDAGCDNADVLDHCRDPKGVHVRGCWVVDSVLGKA